MSQSMHELEDHQPRSLPLHQDPMTQSLGPEQLARSLGHPINDESSHHLTNGDADSSWIHSHPTRPTTLFQDQQQLDDDNDEGTIFKFPLIKL